MSYKDFHLLFELNPYKQKLIYAFNGDQTKAKNQMKKLLVKINNDEELVNLFKEDTPVSLNSHQKLNQVINSVLG